MNGDMNERDILAAEYVLGVLEADDWARAERLLVEDRGFALEVDAWNRRLLPALEALPPQTPRPQVWRRIQAELDRRREQEVRQTIIRPAPGRASLFDRLGFWRWCSFGTAALAAGLAAIVALGPTLGPSYMPWWPQPAEQQTKFVAVLNEGAATPTWLVTVDLEAQALTIRPLNESPVQQAAAEQRSLELWLVAGAAPVSLGLLDPAGELTLPTAAVLSPDLASATPALAVSLEPAGGSPTGAPTGPVLYQGAILPISAED